MTTPTTKNVLYRTAQLRTDIEPPAFYERGQYVRVRYLGADIFEITSGREGFEKLTRRAVHRTALQSFCL